MDTLDKFTSFILAGLVVWTTVLVAGQAVLPPSDRKPRAGGRIETGLYANPEFEKKTETARRLLAAGNLELAEPLIASLKTDFPYEGTPHILHADLFIRRQQPVAAMREHRLGIELNPDFLDKKTPLFQGKIIKRNLEEALVAINGGLAREPADQAMLDNKRVYNYLKRRLAGSCS